MALTQTGYEHVIMSEAGTPIIAGTTTKVIELVAEKHAYGWSPEEMHLNHPYLSLGQIYSALAYYWDHSDELDADIARRLQEVDDLRQQLGPSQLSARLRATR